VAVLLISFWRRRHCTNFREVLVIPLVARSGLRLAIDRKRKKKTQQSAARGKCNDGQDERQGSSKHAQKKKYQSEARVKQE
jgi:hypothetical protein